jgi:hypothetical protein
MIWNQVRTRTRDVVLVDDVRESPVDEQLLQSQRKVLSFLLFVLVVILVVKLV